MGKAGPSSLLVLFVGVGVCLFGAGTLAARVLAVFPFSSASHRNLIGALTLELASRGHHITLVTPHLVDSPPENFTQVDVSSAVAPHYDPYGHTRTIKVTDVLWRLMNTTTHICRDVLALPQVRRLMDPKASGQGFDLLLTSVFFSECYHPFAHAYDVPIVLLCPGGPLPNTDALVGNVALPSFVPVVFLPFADRMSFVERLVNFVAALAYELFVEFLLYPRYEEICREHFGAHPPLSELRHRISLVLYNDQFAYSYPRPLTPNAIEVGGMHINPPKPLPKDLQSYLDEATEGVVYFSMGMNLKSVNFPTEKREAIFGAFSELRQRVLIKWEGDGALPGQPSNVRLQKWIPQADLLAHPNVKVFVTHGGLLSFQEAIARGVPVIGIPFFGDQELNMKKVLRAGVGLRVSYDDLTKESFLEAIMKVLEDPSYRENMRQLSAAALDQPDHPLQRAVFWTEYVIRHRGAKRLQPASRDLRWFQLYSLDVIVALASVPALFIAVVGYFLARGCVWKRWVDDKPQAKREKAKKQ